jgi:hypothetical protein
LYTRPELVAPSLLKAGGYACLPFSRLPDFKSVLVDAFCIPDDELQVFIADREVRKLQEKRNAFIHDDPAAIDEQLIAATLTHLQDVQAAWIKLYNKRCIVLTTLSTALNWMKRLASTRSWKS